MPGRKGEGSRIRIEVRKRNESLQKKNYIRKRQKVKRGKKREKERKRERKKKDRDRIKKGKKEKRNNKLRPIFWFNYKRRVAFRFFCSFETQLF